MRIVTKYCGYVSRYVSRKSGIVTSPPRPTKIQLQLWLVANSRTSKRNVRSVPSDLQHIVSNEFPWMVRQEPVFDRVRIDDCVCGYG